MADLWGREGIRAEVMERPPVDDRERLSIERFLELFDRLERPFDEAADPTHVTASAIVVGRRGVILHRHRRLGIWLQPGGHIDVGESPGAAARRETLEETGLVAVHAAGRPLLVHVDVHPGPRGHTHLDLRYLLVADDGDPSPPAGESPDVGWFTWPEAVAMSDVGLRGALVALDPDHAGIDIRPAVDGDAAHLAELYLRSRRLVMPGFVWPHDDFDVRKWMAATTVPRGVTWVATVGGVPVGLAVVAAGWIEQLYVDPPWIGRGVGRRLLEHALVVTAGEVQVWVFQANHRARAFYERHGFVAAEFTDGAGNDERRPDVRYLRRP